MRSEKEWTAEELKMTEIRRDLRGSAGICMGSSTIMLCV
jgi:hypothetical protein